MQHSVRDILKQKGGSIWSVEPGTTVFEVLQLMAEKEIGSVMVMEGERPLGIFTERHYSREVILKGKSSRDTPVSEIMTARIIYVRPDQTVGDCMALMTDKRVRHLPVMENDKLIGILSIGDVVKAIISEKQFLIEQLENYITSG